MKIFIVIVFSMLLCFPSISKASNDPWYDLGYKLGTSISNNISSGNDEKNFYYDESYNISNTKLFVIGCSVKPNVKEYVSDKYMGQKYPKILKKILLEKFSDKDKAVEVITIEEFVDAYMKNVAPMFPDYSPEEHIDNIFRSIDLLNGLYINADVLVYMQGPYYANVGNCYISFDVYKGNNVILNYSDKRLNANRSSKEGMAERIGKAFSNKLYKVYNNEETN